MRSFRISGNSTVSSDNAKDPPAHERRSLVEPKSLVVAGKAAGGRAAGLMFGSSER